MCFLHNWSGKDKGKFFRLAPGLKGLGYGMSMIPTVVNFYYVVIMAYALLFLFYGFTSKLPWTDCTNDWNSANCFSLTEQFQCSSFIARNNTYCLDSDNKPLSLGDVTKRMYPSEEFWNTKILVCNMHSLSHSKRLLTM